MLPTNQNIQLAFSEGLTQSEMMERCNCPRKHMFRYILQLKKQGSFSWALLTGGAVHELLELHYRLLQRTGKGLEDPKAVEFEFESDVILSPEDHELYKYWQLVAGMLVYRHNIYYEEIDKKLNILNVEVPIDIEYRGFRLRGMIDLVAESPGKIKPWITDHKTTADLNDIRMEGWQYRFQFLFYAWMWTKMTGQRPSGTMTNLIKKPQERRSTKRGESVEDFCRRIDYNIMANPSEFFKREWIPLDDAMLERFERYTLDPVLTQFQMLQEATDENGRFNQQEKEALLLTPNTDHCTYWNVKCEFMDLCKNNFEDFAMEFIKRHTKHPELNRN